MANKYRAGNMGADWALEVQSPLSEQDNSWYIVSVEKEVRHKRKWIIRLIAWYLNRSNK